MTTDNYNVPMVDCPYCQHEFQVDDYYDMGVESEFDCPECERTIAILATDIQVIWPLGTLEDLAENKRRADKAREHSLKIIREAAVRSPMSASPNKQAT